MKAKLPLVLLLFSNLFLFAQHSKTLKLEPKRTMESDWLINSSEYKAGVFASGRNDEIILSNGLLKRTFRISPNLASIGLTNNKDVQFMRAVTPEAKVQINGVNYNIGGLTGQRDKAYIDAGWIDDMKADPQAMQFTGYKVMEPKERFGWKRVRHHAADVNWPPKGVHLQLDFKMPEISAEELYTGVSQPSHVGHDLLIEDKFESLADQWTIVKTDSHPRSSFENEGRTGEIYTPMNTVVYAEHDLPSGTKIVQATIEAGTDKSRWWGPGIALVWKDKVVKMHMSPGGDGYRYYTCLAGFDGKKTIYRLGQQDIDSTIPWTLRLRIVGNTLFFDAKPEGFDWRNTYKITFDAPLEDPQKVRIGKMGSKGDDKDGDTKGELVRTTIIDFAAFGEMQPEKIKQLNQQQEQHKNVTVSVHYELYDGIPAYSKWLTVNNNTSQKITVNRFTSEILAAVEYTSRVGSVRGIYFPRPNIHVETDYAFQGDNVSTSSRHSVHWEADPDYKSQVMFLKTTPCLLKVQPTLGPEQDVEQGESFESFRAFIMPFDSYERERKSLSLKRLYKTIAPWTTENPLIMKVRYSDWDHVKFAIDQCSEVGFEMATLSHDKHFNLEDDSEERIAKMKEYSDYARSKGIEIGGYSLLASRSAKSKTDNVVSPPGQKPKFGVAPSLASPWGQDYFRKLYDFFKNTGFNQLTNDGSYAGDFDIKARPPYQKGLYDSQWVQWRIISDFYKWCRSEGIFLLVPDYYFLTGSNKMGMGYLENGWSLPRAQQVIHTRQNIYDGTWEKSTTMGWMFVPLMEYHGGGAAATIEPLEEHIDQYEMLMACNLGSGAQAVYRGRRLYDTDKTKAMVKRMVNWYKQYRDILDSDIVHIRRPDGSDYDGILHVNPKLKEKGFLMVFNPLQKEITRTIKVPLYYTGLDQIALIREKEGKVKQYKLDRDYSVDIEIKIPAMGYNWYVIE